MVSHKTSHVCPVSCKCSQRNQALHGTWTTFDTFLFKTKQKKSKYNYCDVSKAVRDLWFQRTALQRITSKHLIKQTGLISRADTKTMPWALRAVLSWGTFLYEDSQQLRSCAVIWSLIEVKHVRVRGTLCYLTNRMSKSHYMVPVLKITYRRLTTVSLAIRISRIRLQIPGTAREAGHTYLGHYVARGSIIYNPIFLVCCSQPHPMTLAHP